MRGVTINISQFKELLKATILELLPEAREAFSNLLSERMEHIVMEQAIKEGEDTEPVSREAIFKIL